MFEPIYILLSLILVFLIPIYAYIYFMSYLELLFTRLRVSQWYDALIVKNFWPTLMERHPRPQLLTRVLLWRSQLR